MSRPIPEGYDIPETCKMLCVGASGDKCFNCGREDGDFCPEYRQAITDRDSEVARVNKPSIEDQVADIRREQQKRIGRDCGRDGNSRNAPTRISKEDLKAYLDGILEKAPPEVSEPDKDALIRELVEENETLRALLRPFAAQFANLRDHGTAGLSQTTIGDYACAYRAFHRLDETPRLERR